ncbi:hypothetical protein ON010_g15195 [Phytophthora cinnamomi]|nr:hypothetical protein ON010_g15195 [Phytophthora cinnamomi]
MIPDDEPEMLLGSSLDITATQPNQHQCSTSFLYKSNSHAASTVDEVPALARERGLVLRRLRHGLHRGEHVLVLQVRQLPPVRELLPAGHSWLRGVQAAARGARGLRAAQGHGRVQEQGARGGLHGAAQDGVPRRGGLVQLPGQVDHGRRAIPAHQHARGARHRDPAPGRRDTRHARAAADPRAG